MRGHDFIVAARSWAQIEMEALNIRQRFGLADEAEFPVFDFIERVLDQQLELVRFEVGTELEMGSAMGHTDPAGEFIEIRGDVYRKGCAGDGMSRFTAAHELGHFFLHSNRPMARLQKHHGQPEAFRLAEPQADQFAAELLMPARFFQKFDDARDVMRRHGVSYSAACKRLAYLEKRGRLPK